MKRRLFLIVFLTMITFMLSGQLAYGPAQESRIEKKRSEIQRQTEEETRPLKKMERWQKDKDFYLQQQSNRVKDAVLSSNVELVGIWPYGHLGNSDLDTSRNIAVIGHGSAIQVVDITTPSSLTVLGEVVIDEKISDIAISGNYAYVGTMDSPAIFYVIDITDITNPSIEGNITLIDMCYSIEVSGTHAYVA